MQIVMEVLVTILATGHMTKPGHAANTALEPVPVWPLEYLVVETCRPKPVREIQHTAEVKVDAWETAWRFYLMAVNQCAHGSTYRGYVSIAIVCCQQRIGLFHTRGHDAARPVIFETPVNRADAVGQQC